MYAFVDLPFSPSGVTHIVRRHRAVGFEKELQELDEVLKAAAEGNNNVLATVIAPYGFGKSELLDELEELAKSRGFDVVKTALSLEGDFALEVSRKKKDKPMLIILDEADEISRLAAAHKLGALSDERFMKLVQKTATYIRALLEPKSYRHMLGGEPERFNKIAIVAALTPQLYYTILKNVVPDVFDIASGRVYREIVVDTRLPFWQFIETVKQRLAAYSSPERLRLVESGKIDSLSPFALHELAAIYHLAKRRGEISPRRLLKLVARLFQLKKEGRRLADLLREEGVEADLDEDLLEAVYAGLPYDRPIAGASRQVFLYRIPYGDKEALNIARRTLGIELDLKDPKNVSYEPYVYYALLEGAELYVYLISELDLNMPLYLVGQRYVVDEDVAKRILGDEAKSVAALAREYYERLESPVALMNEIEQALSISGIKIRLCCGHVTWRQDMGIREAYFFLHVDRDEELQKTAALLSDVITQGSVGGYVVDYIHVIVASKVLLTDTLSAALTPLLSAYWKRHYRDVAANFVTLQIYGADRLERLKQELVRYMVDKFLKRDSRPPQFVDAARLGREKAREMIARYTLALRRGREKKLTALAKVAEAIDKGAEVEGFASYAAIEEILLSAFEDSIHERELRSLVNALFPVNLWREVREDDVINIMILRGVLIPHGDRLYKYSDALARQHIAELAGQLGSLSEVVVEKQTPLGKLRVVKKLEVPEINVEINNREEYAKAVRELLVKISELRERHEAVRKEVEKELEEKFKLLKRASAILEKYPQRAKYLTDITEDLLKKEERIISKAEEALQIWREVKHMANALKSQIYVESDLKLLLNLPEPWLDDYVAGLRIFAAELAKRYEKLVEIERINKMALDWLNSRLKLNATNIDEALAKASQILDVHKGLLYEVAKRGNGALLDVKELAKAANLEEAAVELQLEKLHKAGLVERKYVVA